MSDEALLEIVKTIAETICALGIAGMITFFLVYLIKLMQENPHLDRLIRKVSDNGRN